MKMPESTVYRSWYGPEARKEVSAFFEELRDRCGAETIDATEWVPDGHFVDEHHVTTEGSHEFSARLHQELQRLLSRPESVAERQAPKELAVE